MFGSTPEQILFYLTLFLFLLGILGLILPLRKKMDKNFIIFRTTGNGNEAALIGFSLEQARIPFALRHVQNGKDADFRALENQSIDPVQFEIYRSFQFEAEKVMKDLGKF